MGEAIARRRLGFGSAVCDFSWFDSRTLRARLQIGSLGVDKPVTMTQQTMSNSTVDDPRKLNSLIARVADLAQSHNINSVIVGMACETGDRLFPEFVEFLRSALRVEDGIYRMTRERAVIHLADLDMDGGQSVFNRLLDEFVEEFPAAKEPSFAINFILIPAGSENLQSKTVLTEIFPSRMLH